MNIYRFKIKKHNHFPLYPEYKKPDSELYITMFYDEDMEAVIREMQKYDKANGFTYTERGKRFSCADLVLTEETPTGEILSETTYREIFDHLGNRI